MADNERLRNPQFPRRNPPTRPPPGVQKALHNFGVPDLRELINKKHQNQGDSPRDKKPEPKENLPPPDPSYNYLKDPARDRPKPPPPKREESKNPPERQHGNSNVKNKHRIAQKEYIHPRYREQQENNNVHGERSSPQNSCQNREDGAAKKELRFTEAPAITEIEPQFPRGGRGGFRGRNPGGFRGRGRGGKPREDRQEKIENPVNIKVQLSTETGQRSCILDENTKIPDIKHVPDQFPHHRSPRGGFRGARGNFRGKKRGSFRGRGDRRDRTENSESPDNANVTEKVNIEENNVADDMNETADVKQEDNEAPYEEYEQESNENEEFVDSNENYEAEFSSEYQEDSPTKNLDGNNLPEQTTNSFDPNLTDTITITSSKYQDGEVKRSVEVKAGVGDANDVGAAENGDYLVKENGADEKVES